MQSAALFRLLFRMFLNQYSPICKINTTENLMKLVFISIISKSIPVHVYQLNLGLGVHIIPHGSVVYILVLTSRN